MEKVIAEKIKSYRENKGWSQKDLAEKMQVPQSMIARIESGTHGVSSNTLIKFLHATEMDIEFTQRANKIDALDVARYVISYTLKKLREDYDVTNMKLNKLLYYIQKRFLKKNGKPLFEDQFFAWRYGPIVLKVYHIFKNRGANPITIDNSEIDNLDSTQKEIINSVLEEKMYMSAYQLKNESHKEDSWIKGQKKKTQEMSLEDIKNS